MGACSKLRAAIEAARAAAQDHFATDAVHLHVVRIDETEGSAPSSERQRHSNSGIAREDQP